MIRWPLYLLAWAFLGLFLVLPVATALGVGLDWTFLREALLHPVNQAGLFNALAIACGATAVAAAIALPMAWLTARHRLPGGAVAEALLLTPLILPPFVGALGFEAVLGRFGALNTLLANCGLIDPAAPPDWLGAHRFAAICLIEGFALYPFLYLTAAAAIARIDPALGEAARIAGARPWRRLTRITLPILRPGLFAGGIVIFVWAFTELGTPLMLGYDRHIAVQVWNGLAEAELNRLPYAQVAVMLTVAAALYALAKWRFGGDSATAGKGAVATVVPPLLTGGRAVLAWAAVLAVVGLAAAPHLAVVALAFGRDWHASILPAGWTTGQLAAAFAHPDVVPAIANSLRYAALATVLAVALGAFIAWCGTRWRPPFAAGLDALAMLPLAVPGVVLAFGYLAISTGIPWLRAWLDPLRDPTAILVIAYGVRRLPHATRAAHAGFATTPVALEEAGAVLGAGPWLRLRRIVLPLIAGGLAAGALLAFSASVLEVSDSLILAQRRDFFPLTKVMFNLVDILGAGPAIACAVAAWAMLFLAAAFAAAAALTGRSLGEVFRAR
jgi:iron(III) transport system permease protein